MEVYIPYAPMLTTQRVFWTAFDTDEKLSRLLAFLKRHRGLTDEISFFTEGDGCDFRYLSPDEVRRRASYLTSVVATVRQEGFVPVINILNTLGHSDEGGPESPVIPWQGMVGIDGSQARQCSCPADLQFLDYVRFKYEQFGCCGAKRYWVDDDLRMGNHQPVGWGCFCPGCLEDFSRLIGRRFDLQELAAALRCDRVVRNQWITRNASVKRTLLMACAEGLARTNPGAEIGLMICDVADLLDTGADIAGWLTEMSRITGGRAWVRSGGGFWDDGNPRGMLRKVHGVANSADRLPFGVGSAYELENYPFILGNKSAEITGLECLMAILGSRLDGIMFDMLDPAGNNLEPFERWTTDLESWLPKWKLAADAVKGTLPAGWRPVYSVKHFEQHAEDREPQRLLSSDYQKPRTLQLAGFPVTGFSAETDGYLLGGEAALGMSVGELTGLLDKPLIMDGEAARCFLAAGLGARIGIRSATPRTEGAYEVFTDHAVNGETAGYRRTMTMKYFGLCSHALEPEDGTESLSTLMTYSGVTLGSALTLFRPADAPPVAILCHAPWTHVLSPERMTQMRRLTSKMIPGLPSIQSCDRAVVFWWRRDRAGKRVAILFNPGFDDATVVLEGIATPAVVLASLGVVLASPKLYLPGWEFAVLMEG